MLANGAGGACVAVAAGDTRPRVIIVSGVDGSCYRGYERPIALQVAYLHLVPVHLFRAPTEFLSLHRDSESACVKLSCYPVFELTSSVGRTVPKFASDALRGRGPTRIEEVCKRFRISLIPAVLCWCLACWPLSPVLRRVFYHWTLGRPAALFH